MYTHTYSIGALKRKTRLNFQLRIFPLQSCVYRIFYPQRLTSNPSLAAALSFINTFILLFISSIINTFILSFIPSLILLFFQLYLLLLILLFFHSYLLLSILLFFHSHLLLLMLYTFLPVETGQNLNLYNRLICCGSPCIY